jgi:protein gp37
MTKIEWVARPGTTPESWNPVSGCSPKSEGCHNCYAERMARRLAGRCGYPEQPHHFDVTLHPDRLDIPLRWRKPRTVFVCSMSDLFHKDISDKYIDRVFQVMAEANRSHTFLLLTKRPERMRALWTDWIENGLGGIVPRNVWGLVTVENQDEAWRVIELLQTPFAIRGVSCEPLLEPIDLSPHLPQECAVHHAIHRNGRDCLRPRDDQPVCLDWAICGGESGPGARPMHPDWVRLLKNQCQKAGVPFFFKGWGAWSPYPPSPDVQDRCQTTILPERNQWMWRVGKHRAGRLLGRRQWNEWPK